MGFFTQRNLESDIIERVQITLSDKERESIYNHFNEDTNMKSIDDFWDWFEFLEPSQLEEVDDYINMCQMTD